MKEASFVMQYFGTKIFMVVQRCPLKRGVK